MTQLAEWSIGLSGLWCKDGYHQHFMLNRYLLLTVKKTKINENNLGMTHLKELDRIIVLLNINGLGISEFST